MRVAGGELHSEVTGAGPPAVVLHHSFGHVPNSELNALLAETHRVHTVDLPGFGRSDRPDWARHPRDLAMILGRWIDRTNLEGALVIGPGFGGWVAAELATMSPARIGRLVLVGAAGVLPRAGRILDQMLTSHSNYVRAAFGDDAVYERVFGGDLSDELLVAWDVHREMVARVAWKPYMYDRQMEAMLCEVETPTLVVWGDRDRVVPLECGQRYADQLPCARLAVVENCGHAVDLEHPNELCALIRSFAGCGEEAG